MKRNFDLWLGKFQKSIADYGYYVDFGKVYTNVEAIKVELNILNSLIGSKNIEHEFAMLLKSYPNILKCIPVILAVREKEISATDDLGSFDYNFDKMNYSIEMYQYFMRKTGIFELLETHIISNLVDYVTGVEVGLNSNGRKNLN